MATDELQELARRIRLLLDARGRDALVLSNYRGGSELRSHGFYFRSGRDGSIYVNDLNQEYVRTVFTQKSAVDAVDITYPGWQESIDRLRSAVDELTVLESLADV